MRIIEQDDKGNRVCWLAFPVSEEFAHTGEVVFGEAIDGNSGHGHPRMKNHMFGFAEQGIHFYARKPLKMMRFGPILKKVTEVAVDGIDKSVRNAVRDIVPKLNKEEARRVADYFGKLTVEK